jgi:hypothetical protein
VRSRTAEQRLWSLLLWNGDVASVENSMWLIVGAVVVSIALLIVGVGIVSIAVVVILRMRVAGGVNGSELGRMSEQWLTEHRASHSAK